MEPLRHALKPWSKPLQGYTMVEGSPRWRRGTAAQEAAFAAAEAAVAAAESPTAAADRSELDARQVFADLLADTRPSAHAWSSALWRSSEQGLAHRITYRYGQ